MDIRCARCGEPWDTIAIHEDMIGRDRRRFYEGEGCPTCGFGTICPACHGTGRFIAYPHTHHCPTCLGTCYVILRRRVFADGTTDPTNNRWAYGYNQSYRTIPEPPADEIIQRYRDEYVGGYATPQGAFVIQQIKVRCWEPACRESAPLCPICGGDGAFHEPDEPTRTERQDQFWWDCFENRDE